MIEGHVYSWKGTLLTEPLASVFLCLTLSFSGNCFLKSIDNKPCNDKTLGTSLKSCLKRLISGAWGNLKDIKDIPIIYFKDRSMNDQTDINHTWKINHWVYCRCNPMHMISHAKSKKKNLFLCLIVIPEYNLPLVQTPMTEETSCTHLVNL